MRGKRAKAGKSYGIEYVELKLYELNSQLKWISVKKVKPQELSRAKPYGWCWCIWWWRLCGDWIVTPRCSFPLLTKLTTKYTPLHYDNITYHNRGAGRIEWIESKPSHQTKIYLYFHIKSTFYSTHYINIHTFDRNTYEIFLQQHRFNYQILLIWNGMRRYTEDIWSQYKVCYMICVYNSTIPPKYQSE